MNKVQNMDEPHWNLLSIRVFDTGGNLLGFGEKGRKNYGTNVAGWAYWTLWILASLASSRR